MRVNGLLVVSLLVLAVCIGVVVYTTGGQANTVDVNGVAQVVSHASGVKPLGTDGNSFLDGLMAFSRCLADAGDDVSKGMACW